MAARCSVICEFVVAAFVGDNKLDLLLLLLLFLLLLRRRRLLKTTVGHSAHHSGYVRSKKPLHRRQLVVTMRHTALKDIEYRNTDDIQLTTPL